MSLDFFVMPAPGQSRRWGLELDELDAAILRRWPDADVVQPRLPEQYFDFTVAEDGESFDFSFDPGGQCLVFAYQEPLPALARVVQWFLDTAGPDVPVTWYSNIDATERPLPAGVGVDRILDELMVYF